MLLYVKIGWILVFTVFAGNIIAQSNTANSQEPASFSAWTESNISDSTDTTPDFSREIPDPVYTIWLGAVIPGYGQILNRKFWKLPIVYGGFLGSAYAIGWNSRRFIAYKNAYLDITDTDATTNSFLDLIPDGYTIQSYGGQQAFTNLLKSGMDRARYNRDLSVIVSVAFYGITLIDAFVDAHLADFDISPDLSLRMRPALLKDNNAINLLPSSTAFGLTGSIKF